MHEAITRSRGLIMGRQPRASASIRAPAASLRAVRLKEGYSFFKWKHIECDFIGYLAQSENRDVISTRSLLIMQRPIADAPRCASQTTRRRLRASSAQYRVGAGYPRSVAATFDLAIAEGELSGNLGDDD